MSPLVWGFLVVVLVLTWYAVRARLARSAYLAHTEYWVYVRSEELPKIEAVMDRMISANPYNRRGNACIGAKEGMLFTDIRLHVGLARREKNPALFRPDLESATVVPSREALEALAECHMLARVSYVADKSLPDRRHLQFLPHYAAALSDLMDGVVVFDRVSEELLLASEMQARMKSLPNWERIDAHCRVVEVSEDGGLSIQTRGLRKIGLPELASLPVPPDERQTARMVVEESLVRIWKKGELTLEWSVKVMDTSFQVRIESQTLKEARLRILREVEA